MELSKLDIVERFTVIFGLISLRYVFFAGVAFILLYVFRNKIIKRKKIQEKDPERSDYRRDILYSVLTILIFTIVGVSLFIPVIRENSQIYSNITDYGWGYFIFSVLLIILVHDTYFYWMHRLIHHPALFKRVHLIHHKSTNPSPWTALAFHPTEAVFEASIIYIVAFLFPIHMLSIFTFLLFMFMYNVYGHCGYELFPKSFYKSKVGKWFNTSVSHNQHHHYFHGNYGLYFLFWDRWMGTLREDYDRDYLKATEKSLPDTPEVSYH